MPNFDGIKKLKLPTALKKPTVRRFIVRVESVTILPQKIAPQKRQVFWRTAVWKINALEQASRRRLLKIWQKIYLQPKIPFAVAVVALLIAFSGGMWTVLTTRNISAEDVTQADASAPANPAPGTIAIPLPDADTSLGPANDAPSNPLYSMTVSQLENYFKDQADAAAQAQQQAFIAQRAAKLKTYLQEKNSPLADIADTIAGLKNWNIVLAVSNSESSLGKHCYNNNCSGIGVDPSNPLWHNYASKQDWAISLDNLIEKRYKNWTLEQMNGVYNKPGSSNWVAAATQVLEELKENGID